MVVRRGETFWAELEEPRGSRPGFRRPVVVIQDDIFNVAGWKTVTVIPLTSNLKQAKISSHVLLPAAASGLDRDSVALTTQILTVDRSELVERTGSLPKALLEELDLGVMAALGLLP